MREILQASSPMWDLICNSPAVVFLEKLIPPELPVAPDTDFEARIFYNGKRTINI